MIRILFGLLILAALGGGGWVLVQNNTETVDTNATENATPQNRETDTFEITTTLIELLERGDALMCTYTVTEEAMTGSGTVYLDGLSRFRVDGTQTRTDGTFDTDIIYTPERMSMWVVGGGKTMAFTVPVEKPITELDTSAGSGSLNTEMVHNTTTYTCTRWSVDESVFEEPEGINFMDMRTLFQSR